MLRVTGLLLNRENSHNSVSYMNTELPPTIDLPAHLSAEFTATLDAAAAVDHLMSEFITKAEARLVALRAAKCALLDRASAELGLTKEQMMQYRPVRVVDGTQLVLGEESAAGDEKDESEPALIQIPGAPPEVQKMMQGLVQTLGKKMGGIGFAVQIEQSVQVLKKPTTPAQPESTDPSADDGDTGEQTHTA